MAKKIKSSKGVQLALLGVAIAGLAATTYFFYGPKGKTNRKHLKAWAIKMKGDVIEKLEKAKDVTESTYHSIIDSVAKEYAKDSKIAKNEVSALAKDLKKHWKAIAKIAGKTKKKVKK